MINPNQIPDEVVEAAAYKYRTAPVMLSHTEAIRAAIAAALGAWPGVQRVKGYFTHDTDYYEPAFILPVPTEVSDD